MKVSGSGLKAQDLEFGVYLGPPIYLFGSPNKNPNPKNHTKPKKGTTVEGLGKP